MPLLVLALLACGTDPPAPMPDAPGAVDATHLYRAAIAMRGAPPSAQDLAAYRADPTQLEPILRSYLSDPGFAAAVRDQHAETLKLRGHIVGKVPATGPLDGVSSAQLDIDIDEMPLYLASDIVTSGRPYTELLTTELTFTNEATSIVHGLSYDPDGPTWQPAPWTDGRPAAGILSDTAILQRYQSSLSNHHRGRAAVVLSSVMCSEVLESTLDVVPPQIGEPSQDIVRTDPSCSGCHAALDPVASAFSGFDPYILRTDILDAYRAGCPEGAPCYPLDFFDTEASGDWAAFDMPAPAWKGVPVDGLAGLGQALAADPDFAECTARRFHGWHTGRDPWAVPDAVAQELADVLVEHSFDARELVVASLLHEDFATAPRRPIRPEEMARSVHAITGYRWTRDLNGAVLDLPTSSRVGYRTLLGGTDGWDVLEPARTPTPSAVLAREALAVRAGIHAVKRARDRAPAERTLFTVAAPGPMSDDLARKQLVVLHELVLAMTLDDDDPAIDDALELLRALEAVDDAETAWAWVLSALLQHDRLVLP